MDQPIDPPLLSHLEASKGPFHYGGDAVLVYRRPATSVRLITWMPRFPPPPAFRRVREDLWYLRLRIPATARIEYRLGVGHNGRTEETDDPLNPPSASNPFGTNSLITGPGYVPPWYAAVPDLRGQGERFEIRVASAALGGRRHHHVYLPAGIPIGDLQGVLLVHDGTDFVRFAGLAGCLDRLVEAGQVAPIALVLLDPWQRILEYGAWGGHSQHLADEVLPHLDRRLRLRFAPTATGLLGSSLGAVAALAATYHYPDHFSLVGLISGSFAHRADDHRPPEVFDPVIAFLHALDPTVLDGMGVYQSVGRYEGLVDFNRRLAPILRAGGVHLRSVETWTGHDWGAWRDRLGEALIFLFPGPDAKG